MNQPSSHTSSDNHEVEAEGAQDAPPSSATLKTKSTSARPKAQKHTEAYSGGTKQVPGEGWWTPPGWRHSFSWLGLPYGYLTTRRMHLPPDRTASLPVVCIGNFVAGGSGKTPVALAVARELRKLDLKPVFLTRGYLGQTKGPLLVDEELHTSTDVGDEALLLTRSEWTVVAADRPSGAECAAWLGADVVVMDDGFQNPSLKKDLSIIVVDGRVGVGNGLVLPVGPLRAPLRSQLPLADMILVVGPVGPQATKVVRRAARFGIPITYADTVQIGSDQVEGKSVLAFAGIGRPRKFYEDLAQAGAYVVETRSYPDHHAYTRGDASSLLRRADKQGLHLATTAKDFVRLAHHKRGPLAELAQRTSVLDVEIQLKQPQLLQTALSRLSGKQRVFSN